MKLPRPLPFWILLSEVVGVWLDELQQIPLEVTAAPPSAVTFPPVEADWAVMSDIPEMLIVGAIFGGSFLHSKRNNPRNKTNNTGTIDFMEAVLLEFRHKYH
ncbi:MAG: hypothetical protein WCP08_00415 [Prolixibacteraceae bacterium]